MSFKVLIPLFHEEVAPRFDLCSEVFIAVYDDDGEKLEENIIVLPRASSENLCHMILTEKIDLVVCGGIPEEYYQYLKWKNVKVIDAVAGDRESVLARFEAGRLKSGDIVTGTGAERDGTHF